MLVSPAVPNFTRGSHKNTTPRGDRPHHVVRPTAPKWAQTPIPFLQTQYLCLSLLNMP